LKRLLRALPLEPDRVTPDEELNRLLSDGLLEPYDRDGEGAGLGRGEGVGVGVGVL